MLTQAMDMKYAEYGSDGKCTGFWRIVRDGRFMPDRVAMTAGELARQVDRNSDGTVRKTA